MAYYEPDNWVVLKFNTDDPHYRLLVGWSGGYTSGSSWRMNSGIVKVLDDEDFLVFIGDSGSEYACHKDMYGLRMNNAYIFDQIQQKYGDKVTMLDRSTDWFNVDWIINKKRVIE